MHPDSGRTPLRPLRPLRVSCAHLALLSAAAAVLLAACGGPQPAPDPARAVPAAVLVRAAPRNPGAPEQPLDPKAVALQVAEGLEKAGAFTEVISGEGREGEVPPEADYICEVSVRGSGFNPEDSQATDMAFLSTFVWFMSLFPAWWIPDRVYTGSDIEARAAFFPASGEGSNRPVLVEWVPLNNMTLGLVDRGATWQFFLTLILPPFWMDSPPRAQSGLESQALSKVRVAVADGVRGDWPGAALGSEEGCFLVLDPPGTAVPVREGKAGIHGWIAARAPLSELEVLDGGGKVLRSLDAAALKALAVSRKGTEGRLAWRDVEDRLAEGAPRPGALVRLDLEGLPVTGDRALRMKVSVNPRRPASFTLRLEGEP